MIGNMDSTDALSGSDRVFVCGGGHQGISMAGHLALNGVKVTLWNRTYDNVKEVIEKKIIECNGVVRGIAKIEKASTVMSEVVSDFVMVSTPSSAHKDIAKELAPFVHKDMIVILNPGRTFGAVEFAASLREYGAKELPHIAETQTIVYTCRRSSNNSATIFAMKKDVEIAALKNSDIYYIMSKMPDCLKGYFKVVESTMLTSLGNVGMVLHCSPVLMNIGWIESEKVDFKYYYDGISKSIAKFLEKIDAERILVAKAAGYNVESVSDWLNRTYNTDGEGIYDCIRNNESYREIDAPPTINTRYIFEDVPNGLVPVESLGKSIGVATNNISTIIDLANAVMDKDYRKTGRNFSFDFLKQYV